MLKGKIREILGSIKPWQRAPTTQAGVFILKTPCADNHNQIMIELNPVDDIGRPIKRRGLFISNKNQFQMFKDLLNNDDILELIDAVHDINQANGNLGNTGEILKL